MTVVKFDSSADHVLGNVGVATAIDGSDGVVALIAVRNQVC